MKYLIKIDVWCELNERDKELLQAFLIKKSEDCAELFTKNFGVTVQAEELNEK